nr:hypothetical protein RP007_02606 [Rhizobium sp. P007]
MPSRSEKRGGTQRDRVEIAPTFLIIVLSPVPVHPWSKAMNDAASRAAKSSQRSSAMPMKRFYLTNVFSPCPQRPMRQSSRWLALTGRGHPPDRDPARRPPSSGSRGRIEFHARVQFNEQRVGLHTIAADAEAILVEVVRASCPSAAVADDGSAAGARRHQYFERQFLDVRGRSGHCNLPEFVILKGDGTVRASFPDQRAPVEGAIIGR